MYLKIDIYIYHKLISNKSQPLKNNSIKIRSLGWGLSNKTSIQIERRNSDADPQREDNGKTQEEAKEKGKKHQPALILVLLASIIMIK